MQQLKLYRSGILSIGSEGVADFDPYPAGSFYQRHSFGCSFHCKSQNHKQLWWVIEDILEAQWKTRVFLKELLFDSDHHRLAHVKLYLSWNFQPWATSPWRDRKISSNHKSRVHATWVTLAVISVTQPNNNIFSWKFQEWYSIVRATLPWCRQ